VFPTEDALLIPKTEDGRVLFAVPWGGRLLVGTTDEEVAPGTELVVTKQDVGYLLRHLNRYLAYPVTGQDIVSGFAGARPLVGSDAGGDTKKLARDDVIEVDAASGLISIMGGKWTTHRAMAEDTIHSVEESLHRSRTETQTRNYVLFGGKDFTDDYWEKLSRNYPISADTARHLASKFGTAAENVLAVSSKDQSLAEPIIEGYPAIRAEVIYAIRQEMAATIEDILARRIGLQLYSWRRAMDAAPGVGLLMAKELNWSTSVMDAAINGYVGKIRHLVDSAGLSRERSASALQAPSAS
jgi:glycerol-3-phosphate dehydrogenase